MPTVPSIPSQGSTSPSLLDSKPSPENLLMAAATMHEMGKFDQPASPKRGPRRNASLKVVK